MTTTLLAGAVALGRTPETPITERIEGVLEPVATIDLTMNSGFGGAIYQHPPYVQINTQMDHSGRTAFQIDSDGDPLAHNWGASEWRVYDLSVPASPVFLGSVAGAVLGEPVASDGDLMLTVDRMNEYRLFDMSDPTSPALLSTIPNTFGNSGVLGDGLMMVRCASCGVPGGSPGSVSIYDVSDPTSPAHLSDLPMPFVLPNEAMRTRFAAYEFARSGDTVAVKVLTRFYDDRDTFLRVWSDVHQFDISDPSNPVYVRPLTPNSGSLRGHHDTPIAMGDGFSLISMLFDNMGESFGEYREATDLTTGSVLSTIDEVDGEILFNNWMDGTESRSGYVGLVGDVGLMGSSARAIEPGGFGPFHVLLRVVDYTDPASPQVTGVIEGMYAHPSRYAAGTVSTAGRYDPVVVYTEDDHRTQAFGDARVHIFAPFYEEETETPLCLADFDGDNDVDLGDFGVFGAAFGSFAGDAHYDAAADFNDDGDVDLGDFGVFGAQFGSGPVECAP